MHIPVGLPPPASTPDVSDEGFEAIDTLDSPPVAARCCCWPGAPKASSPCGVSGMPYNRKKLILRSVWFCKCERTLTELFKTAKN